MDWRGTVEGFYGTPWSHAARLDHLRYAAGIGFNTYVYAPKDDPYHRERWRDPYPSDASGRLAELAAHARELGIRFVFTVSPGLSMRFADDAEHEALAAKAEQLLAAGVTAFGLLFDDVPPELHDPSDVARFGAGGGGSGAAHGETCRRFAADFLAPHGITEPLLVCPTDYAGVAESDYRAAFARTAPEDVLLAWTGPDIVVGAVSGADIDRATASYGRPLLLWDNFPVNDFDPTRLFLGPLTGREAHGEEAALRGIIANPMPQALASRFALSTVAGWAADPAGYRPAGALAAALDRVAGTGVPDLAPLVRVCAGWPPSADQDPELTEAVAGALRASDASDPALVVVTDRLTELLRACRRASEPAALVDELRPWLAGAAATAAAGLTAVDLLRARLEGAETASAWRRARQALDAAEDHYTTVLRPVVPPFVRAVLDRTAPPETAAGPVAALVTGAEPTAGDRATAEFAAGLGYRVRRVAPEDAALADPALVLVTHSAEPDALTALGAIDVPLLATGRAVTALGLARGHELRMTSARLTVLDAGDPLAAGRTGVVVPVRGPGWLCGADVEGTGARVVARAVEDGSAMVFRYATGDRLADGGVAPAPRVGLFLGPEGPARWLLTEAGRALVAAAVTLTR